VHHRVDGVLQLQDLALDVNRDLLREVAAGYCRGDVGDVADLAGQVTRHEIDAVGKVLPGPGPPFDVSLAAQPAFGADLPRHPRNFGGEGAQLIDHRIDGVLQFEDFAFDVDRNFFGQIASRDRGGHVGDVAYLAGQVAGHEIDAVGEILPRARNALDS